jgi:urease accessory protein
MKLMLSKISPSSNRHQKILQTSLVSISLAIIGLLLIVAPASAHHPTGSQTPDNFLTGFLSGIAHPVIGFDHLAFVVAIGLLAVLKKQGIIIPIAFVVTSLTGTGLHLISVDLPFPELFISVSVLAFGAMLAIKQSPNLGVIVPLAAIAGIFHGYAYGEAVVGAEMTPVVSYMAGFALIQMTIAVATFRITKAFTQKDEEQRLPNLRFAGFTICGIGAAFLSFALFA